ncbi:hypothetical protein J1N35_017403 [Gossypium stocksii]|uniref:DUF4283 domain-containing protein n=1 Tax=Gossypium stocksii TaxID=47602 RepID=A0A9D4A666_9ROSI|nr:hypothetical protein J1N35_017403 [Gossypium stocksii]
MLSSSSGDLANGNGDDASIPDDSNTKKVHFKGSDVSSEDVMVEDPILEPSLPSKNMLVGKETLDQNNKKGRQHFDNSFALIEQDVKKYFVNGVPSIDFSERVYQLLEKEMSTLVVIKMLRRNIGISTLQNRLYEIWRPSKPFQLMDIGNGYFLAKFQDTTYYNKIISQGPWVVFGYYLTVQPWTIDFNSNLPYPNSVLTWIQFSGLPSHFYKKQILMVIGGMVGKVSKLDLNTDNRARGRKIEKGESLGHVVTIVAAAEEETYGPWMLVERKSRRSNLEGNNKGNNLKVEKAQGSRFHFLADLADLEVIPSGKGGINSEQVAVKNKGKAPLINPQIKASTGKEFVTPYTRDRRRNQVQSVTFITSFSFQT